MTNLEEIFEKNKGFARMKEMREAGIQTRDITRAAEHGIIEKVKPGLYKLISYSFDENESFAAVCNANKKAIICLLSAAAFYELTTFIPSEVYTAFPMNTPRFNINYPPCKVYYFKGIKYELGIEEIETGSGKIKIYSKEKTIVDLFRYKNKLGEDMALESLKTYMRSKNKKIGLLADTAQKLKMYKKMEAYIKGGM
ncbi:MAG: type IV toxin-antitoxin system AbiEi family antitoxin domain-containing protein [Melioribacteraceae bacterium]|nr:type IV toxin-antitoxin system AbiEi family antitoxin domain-containing protein [Melioribacteraceae bacterium]MCF8353799.1 type IV toxin-antitoxin system AbiEi family antitoxin domain-containing protein [Melioribacteraceae bacterium]MCF8393635.1 type IV toxin-antitoxin system AbiEi family antitoxin domain-containing protein [Melioribacteraceae bacterium]MCF8419445.1 type IV toxin-antitoxin system AbiEi family antitoxin domain-containing protein [Melioribacteraceae bacterium]